MPTGYVLGESVTKAAYFSLAAGIYLCRDDVVARSSSLAEPPPLLHFSIAEPRASVPLNPRFEELGGRLVIL